MKQYTQYITRRIRSKAIPLTLFFLVVIAGGAVYAAVNVFTNLQAEAGSRTGNVAVLSDTTASGGSAVKFGQAATGACTISGRLTISSANQTEYPAYPLGTQVYVPDGADPWGGCFPGPSNTGVPAGTVLTNYTGSCTITTANTVIDSKTVNCDVLDIRAQGVLITKSHINGRVYIDTDRCNTASFTIRDSRVHTPDKGNRALRACSYVAERVNLSGAGVWRNVSIVQSEIHIFTARSRTSTASTTTPRCAPAAILSSNTIRSTAPCRVMTRLMGVANRRAVLVTRPATVTTLLSCIIQRSGAISIWAQRVVIARGVARLGEPVRARYVISNSSKTSFSAVLPERITGIRPPISVVSMVLLPISRWTCRVMNLPAISGIMVSRCKTYKIHGRTTVAVHRRIVHGDLSGNSGDNLI